MLATNEILILVEKHKRGCPMESSANLCVEEAMQSKIENVARIWALRALRYCVGIFHEDYKRAI